MMMQTQQYSQDQLLNAAYDVTWFETIFLALDRLHDVVSDEDLASVTMMNLADMADWLADIIYTAQETIEEIRDRLPDENTTEAENNG